MPTTAWGIPPCGSLGEPGCDGAETASDVRKRPYRPADTIVVGSRPCWNAEMFLEILGRRPTAHSTDTAKHRRSNTESGFARSVRTARAHTTYSSVRPRRGPPSHLHHIPRIVSMSHEWAGMRCGPTRTRPATYKLARLPRRSSLQANVKLGRNMVGVG